MYNKKKKKLSLDYFSFIKRLMELLRTFSRIRKIELEIQKLTENEDPSIFIFFFININPIFSYLVYENNPQRYAEMLKDKLLDLLEQAFPNPMFVNDLAK